MPQFDLGTYGAEIVLDDKSFTTGLHRAEIEMGNTHEKVNKIGLSFTKIAAGVAGGMAIFNGLSNAFKFAGESTIGANADMEQYQNTLSVVMKSSKKAAETLAWAKNFANKTPFETAEIVDATAKLTAYGLNAKSVLPQIGDMASVMGKSLDQGVEAIADAETGQLERLKEFGITKNMIVQKAKDMRLGLVVNNQGQITDQKKFNQALFALMQDRYKGGMDMQSKTWKGMLSNIRGFMSTAIQQLSQPLFKGLESGLQRIMPLFDGLTSLMNGDMKGFTDSLKKVFGETGAKLIVGFVKTALDAFTAFKEGFNNGFGEMQTKTETIAAWIGNLFYNIRSTIIGIFDIFTGNKENGSQLLESIGLSPSAVNQITGILSNIKKLVVDYVQIVITNFSMMANFAIKAWGIIWPYIQPLLTEILRFVQSTLSKIVSFWDSNGKEIMQAVQNIFNFILSVIKTVMPIVMSIVGSMLKNVEGVISGGLKIIEGIIKLFADIFTGNWNGLWSDIKRILDGALQLIWNLLQLGFIGKAFGVVESFVGKVIGKVGEMTAGLGNLFGKIKNTASTIFGEIYNTIVNPIVKAKSKIGELIDDIKGFFSNLKLELPHFKLPHFSIEGSLDPKTWIKQGLPSISVDWYAKGGYFDNPSIIGIGEQGPEMALPLIGKRMEPFATAVYKKIAGNMKNGNSVNNEHYHFGNVTIQANDPEDFYDKLRRYNQEQIRHLNFLVSSM